jgi:parallel beta-helix repeat protein
MPLKRVPNPNSDANNWGTILNENLAQTNRATDGGFNTVANAGLLPTGLTADDQGKSYLNIQTGLWHEWLGTVWTILGPVAQAGFIVFDQFANRPTTLTAGDAGKLFFYSQTGNFHLWTGTAWRVLNDTAINVKDYGAIGNGIVDDTVALQAAINKVSTACYKVIFPTGEYNLTTTLQVTQSKTILKGEGGKINLKARIYAINIVDFISYVIVDGLFIDNVDNLNAGFVPNGCDPYGDGPDVHAAGVKMKGSYHQIINCTFNKVYSAVFAGAWVWDTISFLEGGSFLASHYTISNNTVYQRGILTECGPDAFFITAPFSKVENNNITMLNGEFARSGIAIDGNGHDAVIQNNRVIGKYRRCVHVEGAGGGRADNPVITTNFFDNSTFAGITEYGTVFVGVGGTPVAETDYLKNAKVCDNTIITSLKGILVLVSSNVTVENNTIYATDSTKFGIELINCRDSFITKNTIVAKNLTVATNNVANAIGISIVGSKNIMTINNFLNFYFSTHGISYYNSVEGAIANNYCIGNGFSGIYAINSKAISITNNVCKNNAKKNDASVLNKCGISVWSCDYAMVTGNTCHDTQATKTQAYGLYVGNSTGAINTNNQSFENIF